VKQIGTLDRHQKGIINAITTGANNARAERLNGSIQELKTIEQDTEIQKISELQYCFFMEIWI